MTASGQRPYDVNTDVATPNICQLIKQISLKQKQPNRQNSVSCFYF